MPTQKIFKQRVRVRMTKTGESYTAARRQLLKKATEPEGPEAAEPTALPEPGDTHGAAEPTRSTDHLTSDDAMQRATGRRHDDWFALLDAWGAAEHGHTEIARWLHETHGVPGWWTQSVTVAYERARGMRDRYQQADGFTISVSRTVAVDSARALEAFTNPAQRRRWLPGAPMRQRPSRARMAARFDWSDPPSRLIVTVVPKGADKATLAVTHERLPDAESAALLKGAWRESLGRLKAFLEPG